MPHVDLPPRPVHPLGESQLSPRARLSPLRGGPHADLALPRRLMRRRVDLDDRGELARWLDLDRWAWQWFATLTFRTPQPCSSHDVTHGWCRYCRAGWPDPGPSVDRALSLARGWWESTASCCPANAFIAVERGRRGRSHVHALLAAGSSAVAEFEFLCKSWRYGRNQFRPFDRARGFNAGYYLGKYLTKEPEGWDILSWN